jgi:hypothetical protein
MNAIPGKFWGKLASPFLLVHGVGHNKDAWFPFFSLCYFNHDKDGSTQLTHNQSHTMDGIATGCSPTLNALLLVYNPQTKTYYEPNSYCFDLYQLPSLVYPQLRHDGGLFCYLLWDKNPTMEEAYPPGTWVERLDQTTNLLLVWTVMDIPLSADTSGSLLYQILF